MIAKSPPLALCIAAGFSLGLSACGGRDAASNAASEQGGTAPPAVPATAGEVAKVAAPTLTDGPDVCFRAIAKQIGADTKVSEINSFFSSGSEIDSSDDEPKGQLTTCSVQYQSPSDPRKLVGTSMNMNTGEFSPPAPVEISVSGGDAAKFNLEDYLIPLSRVNAAGLKPIMDAQKAKMDAIYGKYAWSGVRLESPDAFSNVHTLRLDIDGRLASNDIKAGGYASITTDGKTVTKDYLKP